MNVKSCAAGMNEFGAWHIACDTDGAPALLILQELKFTINLSSLGISYYSAARWIQQNGGASWTTNALGLPTTCAALPVSPANDPF